MSARPLRILVVDDDDADRELVRRLLARGPAGSYEVVEAATASEALELCARIEPDCVLLDRRLPDGDGIDVLARLVSGAAPPRPVVLLTGARDERVARLATELGAREVVDKGSLDAESLAACIRRAVRS